MSAPGLFRRMDPEALFFAFYYQPDSYQQYLAAQVGGVEPPGS
jgi:CCR4-NOT transcription complex subunit 3